MTRTSLARRFACDGFAFPVSAFAADEIARPPGCLEFAVVDAETDAGAAAVHSQARRKRQAAIHAANRTA